jgi:ABC-type uncharacterized transport system substrate-binding protein
MKKACILFFFVMFAAAVLPAQNHYRIEVLQVGSAGIYDAAYEGILDGLARQGLVKGSTVDVSRTVFPVSGEPSLWERISAHFLIKSMAATIAANHPDLVITLGSTSTRAFGPLLREAGIPVIFSGVCPPVDDFGKGLPGVVIRPQPRDVINTALLALPGMDTLGIIRSSNPEACLFTADLTRQAKACGITVISLETSPGEPVASAARDLLAKGVDAFIIPPDSLYEGSGARAVRELAAEAAVQRVPCISALLTGEKGPLITLSPDFEAVGDLTASQARAILIQGRKAGDLKVVSHTDLEFTMDLAVSRRLGISFRPRTDTQFSKN